MESSQYFYTILISLKCLTSFNMCLLIYPAFCQWPNTWTHILKEEMAYSAHGSRGLTPWQAGSKAGTSWQDFIKQSCSFHDGRKQGRRTAPVRPGNRCSTKATLHEPPRHTHRRVLIAWAALKPFLFVCFLRSHLAEWFRLGLTSLCSTGWPGTKGGLLPSSPKWWDHRCAPPCLSKAN